MATIALTLVAPPAPQAGLVKISAKGYLGKEFSDFRQAIEGSKFDGLTKSNFAPLAKVPGILAKLKASDFQVTLDEPLISALQTHLQESEDLSKGAQGRLEAIEAKLAERGLSLYGFQRTGVEWLAPKVGALLADEMGCGKTVQALAALPEDRGIIVVCPAIAKGVWAREAARWRPELTVKILSGRGSFRWPAINEMCILNYDILPEATELGEIPGGVTLIADEAHAIKNFKSRRSAKFAALSEAVRAHQGRTWLLTATPLLNRPSELWSILGAAGIERDVFGSYKQFVSLFHGKKGFFGGMEWGTPDDSVPERLARVSLRRMRVDVLPDLPVKTWQTVETAPSREALRACNELALTLSDAGIAIDDIDEALLKEESLFTEVSRLRTLLAASKIPAMVELVETYEEQEEPIVVFSAHRAPIDHLAERPGWAVITGDTKPADRTRIEDAFQAGDLKGVGATIQAGGVAITLTKAAHAVFVDRDWTPALNAQAEDRLCRIGQTRGCVITSLVLAHAIDRRVTEVTTKKTALVNATLPTAETPLALGQGEQVDLAEFARLVEAVRAEEALEIEAKANQLALKLARAVPRHMPENDEEEWIAESLQRLAALDPDHAYEVNDAGFNRHDGSLGHSLAEQSLTGLSAKQYTLGKALLRKYHRQVGYSPWACPGERGERGECGDCGTRCARLGGEHECADDLAAKFEEMAHGRLDR